MKQCEEGNYFFSHVTFLSTSEVSALFNISSSHANTNLPNRHFHMNNFWYLNIGEFNMSYYTHNYTY